ncbi:MAG: hypothetical protein P8Y24_07130 [Gammaproteobacteria bacterium]
MSYKLVWEPNGIYWKYNGKVSGKEIVDASTSVYGDPRFDNINYKLVDFLDIQSVDMTDNEIALLACQHKAAEQSRQNVKNAIVIGSGKDEVAKKFAAFFSDSSWEVKIFDNLDDANDWVGREPHN